MSDALSLFWDRLDWREVAFTADEVAAWPDDLRGALTGAGILRRGDNSRRIACDACDTGHIEEVGEVPNPDGSLRFYIPCPENGRVWVPQERLLRWVPDLGALADAAAQALGCGPKATTLVPDRVWELGRLVRGQATRNVILARGFAWSDARKVIVDSRKIAIASPPLVLAIGQLPSDDLWSNRVPTVVALNRVLCLGEAMTARLDVLDAALGVVAAQPQPGRRKRRRESRANTIDALTQAIREHLKEARDHAYSLKQRGQAPTLLPRPTEQHLAELVGVSPATVNRCLNKDTHAKQLQVYWQIASDLDQVMKFRK